MTLETSIIFCIEEKRGQILTASDEKNIKNLFLTGDLHVGKSTLIESVLHSLKIEKIGGYHMQAIFENGKKFGFKMISYAGECEIFAHVDFKTDLSFGGFGVRLDVFEDFAVKILREAIPSSRLIVLDEIGAMEKDAANFQRAIEMCLDSDVPVLGVYQQRALWIKELLKKRNDCQIFQVTLQNREELAELVRQNLIQILRKQ